MVLSTYHDVGTSAVSSHNTSANRLRQLTWGATWLFCDVMPLTVTLVSYEKKSHVPPHFSCLSLRNAVVPLKMLLAQCDTDQANSIKLPKSHVTPHFNCLDLKNVMAPFLRPTAVLMLHLIMLPQLNKCSGTIDDATGISWSWYWCQLHHMTKNSYCISFWLSWPSKWNGAIYYTVGIMWHWHLHQRHYMTKKYVAHCFSHLDVMNSVVLLTMLLASYGADASVSSVRWLNKSSCISFWSSWANKWKWCYWWCHQCYVKSTPASFDQISYVGPHFSYLDLENKIVPLTMPTVSCDAHTDSNTFTWPKDWCHTLFQLSLPDEQNDVIYAAVSIMWQQCWYQWNHMTEKVMFHLILIIGT